ncbi:hypothetical protein OGAPHI_001995 [Ogataea philodendri]|uniref:Dynein heavy chain tail domain-containing protein n=1 Tax=Ogataea philodendri TaxID=1378263 RepID=A0A9P8T7R6_9ASCO|nr:uncharacterized protein OGAPHI_001995 [Ogataea philodendri]KAH3668241.1 hypothetical protein OGAPHI_001995 [Ogataea philodendri]
MVIFLKQKGPLVSTKSCSDQVFVAKLPFKSSPRENFEYLESLLQYGISPYFNVLTTNTSSQSVTSTQKKISELTLSFQHLQQTIQVPNLLISAHPIIKNTVQTNQYLAAFSIDLLDENTKTDSKFLNELQSIVNDWAKQVQNITQLVHEPSDGTTLEEVNFWASKEVALLAIQEQLKSPEVQLTLDILRSAKRYHATVTFADTGIADSLNLTIKYTQLLKDLPINDLLSAQSLEKVEDAIFAIFEHLRKLRVTMYPIPRAIELCQTIVEDIIHCIISILFNKNVMELNFAEFSATSHQIDNVLDQIAENVKEFISMARELLRKRSDKFIAVKITIPDDVRQKMIKITEFRQQHEQLNNIMSQVAQINRTAEYSDDLDDAYDLVRNSNPFNFGTDGQRAWLQAEKSYLKKIASLENKLIELLRESLQQSGSPNERFTTLEKYSFLLTRTSIRTSIFDHQHELLQVIQNDLSLLQEEFKRQKYTQQVLQLRSLPRFTSLIIWAGQAKFKIEFLVSRLELVLTKDWSKYPEGKKIESEIKLFLEKLDIDQIYTEWLASFNENSKQAIIEQKIFKIDRTESKDLKIKVNLSATDADLFKEVQMLQIMGFDVPRNISSLSQILETVYPIASALNSSVINLESTISQIDQLGELKVLLSPYLDAILNSVLALSQFEWTALANAQILIDSGLNDLDEVRIFQAAKNFETETIALLQKFEYLKASRDMHQKSSVPDQ